MMAMPNGLLLYVGRHVEWFVEAQDKVGNRVSVESEGALGAPF